MAVTEMIGEIKNPIKTIVSFNFHSCPTKIFLTYSYNSFVHTLEFWKAIKAIFKRLKKLWNRARKIFRGRGLETSWVATLLRLGEGNDCNFSRCNCPRLRPPLHMPGLLVAGQPFCWCKASTVWIVMAVSMAAGFDLRAASVSPAPRPTIAGVIVGVLCSRLHRFPEISTHWIICWFYFPKVTISCRRFLLPNHIIRMEKAHPNLRCGSSVKIINVQQTQRSLPRIILRPIWISLCNKVDNIVSQNMISFLPHAPIQQRAAIIGEKKGWDLWPIFAPWIIGKLMLLEFKLI